VLTDGVVEDMIWTAMQEAKRQVKDLADKFSMMAFALDHEAVDA
jgi:DNA-binding protein YbaB